MNIYLRRGREQRVLGGHPWVFRSDIEREDGASDGLPVRVLTSAGRFLAMAVYNPRSQISLRIPRGKVVAFPPRPPQAPRD